MADTAADIGYGTTFSTGDGASPEVYTELAEVTKITPPNISRDAVEATHMKSPNAWREFIAGLKNGGDVSLEINYDPNGAAATSFMAELGLSGVNAKKNRKITFTDGTVWSFKGILTAFEPDAPIDDRMVASVTFKVTGEPTFV